MDTRSRQPITQEVRLPPPVFDSGRPTPSRRDPLFALLAVGVILLVGLGLFGTILNLAERARDKPMNAFVARGTPGTPAVVGGAAATPAASPPTSPTGPPRPTETPPPAPAAAPSAPPVSAARVYGLNELVRVQRWEMAVADVERPGTAFVWSRFGGRSAAGGTWVIVAFDLKNTGPAHANVAFADFELRDAGGARYVLNVTPGAFLYSEERRGQAIGHPVLPGATARYYLIFDVPPTATGLHFVFKQDAQPAFAIGNAAP